MYDASLGRHINLNGRSFEMARTLKQQIKKVIREHYGEELGMYKGENSNKIMDAL